MNNPELQIDDASKSIAERLCDAMRATHEIPRKTVMKELDLTFVRSGQELTISGLDNGYFYGLATEIDIITSMEWAPYTCTYLYQDAYTKKAKFKLVCTDPDAVLRPDSLKFLVR